MSDQQRVRFVLSERQKRWMKRFDVKSSDLSHCSHYNIDMTLIDQLDQVGFTVLCFGAMAGLQLWSPWGPGSVEPGADDFEGPAVDFVLVDGSQSQRPLGAGDCSGWR